MVLYVRTRVHDFYVCVSLSAVYTKHFFLLCYLWFLFVRTERIAIYHNMIIHYGTCIGKCD